MEFKDRAHECYLLLLRVNLKSSYLLIVSLFLLLSCSEQKMQGVIDGDDIIPPKPPFWEYFTFYGVDADKDGVRDDVELWINENYPVSDLRKAAKQRAKAMESFLRVKNSNEALIIRREKVKSANCYFFISPWGRLLLMKKARDISDLNRKVINNQWREYLYNKRANFLPSGWYTTADSSKIFQFQSCKFKIENIQEIVELYKREKMFRKEERDFFEKMSKK